MTKAVDLRVERFNAREAGLGCVNGLQVVTRKGRRQLGCAHLMWLFAHGQFTLVVASCPRSIRRNRPALFSNIVIEQLSGENTTTRSSPNA